MTEPIARIRSARAEDVREIRFLIGKAAMEGIAFANIKTIFHPLTISIWVAMASIFIQYMQWWPAPHDGISAYLSLMLPLACSAVPILAYTDWTNRSYFDESSQKTLLGPDMVNILHYYSRSPASGLWLLEFSSRIVGLVALDACRDSEVLQLDATRRATSNQADQSNDRNETAVIRHFYVDEQYHKTGIQKDLLEYALQNAFSGDSAVTQVKASSSPLREYVQKALIEVGFAQKGPTRSIGLYRWTLDSRILTKDVWMQSR